MVSTVPEVLYVCVHNAGRSIAAAVLTDHYAHYLDWELTDPADKTVEEVRPIIDHIDERVRQLLAELLGEAVA